MYVTPDRIDEPLYVVVPIFNAPRYKSRWKLYQRFAKYVVDSGAILVTVEAAFGERQHALDGRAPDGEAAEVTRGDRHIYVRVRTNHEMWIKENLINIGVRHLPADWKYVAWIDGDIIFARPNWVGEIIHQLQHFKFLQLFSFAQDLGPTYEASRQPWRGFVDSYLRGVERPATPGGYYYYAPGKLRAWHPGYAWACTRDAFDAVGGLIDFAILGSGDTHMAWALIGEVERVVPPGMSPDYMARLLEWQNRAEQHIRRNIGVMSGLLLHYWHGRKRDRGYQDRWKILVKNQYQPSLDLKPDWQGVHQLVDRLEPRSLALRDEIRQYARSRNEDSIDE